MKRSIILAVLVLAVVQAAHAWSAFVWTSNPSTADSGPPGYLMKARGTASSNVSMDLSIWKEGTLVADHSANGTTVYVETTQEDTGPQDIDYEGDYYNGWDVDLYVYHTISINAPPDIPTTFSLNSYSFTYTGSSQGPTVQPDPGGANFSTGGTLSATDVGNYTATASAYGGYSGTNNSLNWTINAASVSFSLSSTSFTYNGSAQGPSVIPSPGGATYSTGGTLSATNPGNYTATASAYGNYTGTNNSLGWTINQASQSSVTITSASSVTLGTSYTATATGGSGSGAIEWALGTGSTASGAAIHSSTGVITANSRDSVVIKARRAGDTYYQASAWTSNFTVTINKATPTSSFNDRSRYALTPAGYTVLADDLDASFSGPGGTVVAPTGAIAYTISPASANGTANAAVIAGTVLTCAGTGTTVYTIRATYPGDGNYNTTTKDANWTISYDKDGDTVPDYIETQLGSDLNSARTSDTSDPPATGLKVHKPKQ